MKKNTPTTQGPYSQSINVNGLVFVSGQIGIDPKTNILKQKFIDQVKQCLKNIEIILEKHNCNFQDIVKCEIFLKDIKNFDTFNQLYKKYFKHGKFPTRQTVEVSNLPKNALIEISCIASKNI